MRKKQLIQAVTWAITWGVAAGVAPAHAGDIYFSVGTPGLTAGYSHRYNETVSARVEGSTLGTIRNKQTREGVDFDGKVQSNRWAVLGDWYPMKGSFRLTGGLTFNTSRMDLQVSGAGVNLTVGNRTVVTDATDRWDVAVAYPKVMPYVGLGWGHHQTDGTGFLFDLGVSMGSIKVTEQHQGTNLSKIDQADFDTQLDTLRSDAAKVNILPTLSVGFTFRF